MHNKTGMEKEWVEERWQDGRWSGNRFGGIGNNKVDGGELRRWVGEKERRMMEWRLMAEE